MSIVSEPWSTSESVNCTVLEAICQRTVYHVCEQGTYVPRGESADGKVYDGHREAVQPAALNPANPRCPWSKATWGSCRGKVRQQVGMSLAVPALPKGWFTCQLVKAQRQGVKGWAKN